ncbi:MAG: hypothetical protein V3R98_14875 [Alphaproteobacteria bacterium]
MPLLRHLLWTAVRRLAADPRLQRKAAEAATEAYDKARPKIDAAAREIRDIMRETPPLKDPKGFARKLKERLDGES